MESTEMHEWVPTLTHATERDIDLLLVEELTASRAFLAFVAAHVGWTELPSVWRVLHSKRRIRNRREIDIHVEITASSKTATLLIENKLDASEQPDQAESYREELLRITETSNTFAATLLICPCDYAAQHHVFAAKFDAVLNYEALSAWLRERSEKLVDAETSARLRFRSEMLEQAVGKARRGYLPVPNQVIGGFNARCPSSGFLGQPAA